MNYTVIWRPQPEAALVRLWTAGLDRGAITAAANEIDARLRRNPSTEGESRDDGTRILIVSPLAVAYRVVEEDRAVVVAAVWRWGKQP